MKTKIRQTLTTLLLVMAAVIMINVNSINASAKVKDGTYYFSSCYTSKFKVKKNKLTIKVSGKYGEITKKGNSSFSKKKMTVKLNKKCKYFEKYINKSNGKQSISKSTYKKVKSYIDADKPLTNNVALSMFVVKKGKIVKVTYCAM